MDIPREFDVIAIPLLLNDQRSPAGLGMPIIRQLDSSWADPRVCMERGAILRRETILRAQAKDARGHKLAVGLAQAALEIQQFRHLHEDRCPVCKRLEREDAA
jgi:hypothetical protein